MIYLIAALILFFGIRYYDFKVKHNVSGPFEVIANILTDRKNLPFTMAAAGVYLIYYWDTFSLLSKYFFGYFGGAFILVGFIILWLEIDD